MPLAVDSVQAGTMSEKSTVSWRKLKIVCRLDIASMYPDLMVETQQAWELTWRRL